MSWEKNQKNRDRIKRKKYPIFCEMLRVKYGTPKVIEDLSNKPHPKIPSKAFTAWDYVEWLLDHRYYQKALDVLEPVAAVYNEDYDQKKYERLERYQEDYGVPRTYR